MAALQVALHVAFAGGGRGGGLRLRGWRHSHGHRLDERAPRIAGPGPTAAPNSGPSAAAHAAPRPGALGVLLEGGGRGGGWSSPGGGGSRRRVLAGHAER